jgi:2-keto-4-pentenoate hydratase/2-oxohepta-3-ene-1,7-dioic acid hydratase in catechol pathway
LKLVTFEVNDAQKLGVLKDDKIVDLEAANRLCLSDLPKNDRHLWPSPKTMIEFLEGGDEAVKHVSELVTHALKSRSASKGADNERFVRDLADTRLLAPVPNPPKIICLGSNYRDHVEEAHVPVPSSPVLFSKPNTAIVGHEGRVVYPSISSQVDYEIELAVVIRRSGRNVQESRAFDYIGGYTILNDISARDLQFSLKQWFAGKSFDTFAPTGPCLVLKDQVADPHNLKMQLRVNGELRQNSTTANMIFKIPRLIAFISSVMTLQVGDIISTGTPAGVGFYAKPERKLLKPGDVIEAEIENIGILRNTVVSADTNA